MVHASAFKKDALLQKQFLLLCHIPVANEPPDNLSKALIDISCSRRLSNHMYMKTK